MQEKIKNSTYIIVTNSMHLMGGAELYAIRRARYLKQAHNCNVIFILKEKIEDNGFWNKEMENYKVIHFPEMKKPILFFSKRESTKIVDAIFEKTGGIVNNCYIETHVIHLAGWAELLAQKIKGFNVLYFLNNMPINGRVRFYPYYNFYEYKLSHNEMIGLNKALLPIIFQKKIEEKYNQYVNIGFSSKELVLKSKCDKYTLEEIKEYDFVIGTVGRLEKEYIRVLIEEVITFSVKNKTKKIALLIGGDTPNRELREFYDKSYFKNEEIGRIYPNLNIWHLGYINPLGMDFFKKLDVFVGQGTAVINAISQKVATIVISNLKINGILGIDTDLFGYSDQTIFYDLQEKLKSLLYDSDLLKEAGQKGHSLFVKEYEQNACFKKFDTYLNQLEKPSQYKIKYNIKNRCRDLILYKIKRIYSKLRKI